MKLLFLDSETTGLDPVIHVPWEVAVVLAEHADDGRLIELGGFEAMIPLTSEQLAVADPVALKIGRYDEREFDSPFRRPGEVAAAIDAFCDDRPHLVGAVPSFDDRRVGDMMLRCGVTPRWHYHLIDVEALAMGFMVARASSLVERQQVVGGGAGWKSDDLSNRIGVSPNNYTRHTAMGDVRWAMAIYARVFGLRIESSQ